MQSLESISGVDEQAMSRLLAYRYGDGTIYLIDRADKRLLHQAIRLGLVNEEGYITPSGYRLCLRWEN